MNTRLWKSGNLAQTARFPLSHSRSGGFQIRRTQKERRRTNTMNRPRVVYFPSGAPTSGRRRPKRNPQHSRRAVLGVLRCGLKFLFDSLQNFRFESRPFLIVD